MKKASISLSSGSYVVVPEFSYIKEESYGVVFVDASGNEVAVVNPHHLVYLSISNNKDQVL